MSSWYNTPGDSSSGLNDLGKANLTDIGLTVAKTAGDIATTAIGSQPIHMAQTRKVQQRTVSAGARPDTDVVRRGLDREMRMQFTTINSIADPRLRSVLQGRLRSQYTTALSQANSQANEQYAYNINRTNQLNAQLGANADQVNAEISKSNNQAQYAELARQRAWITQGVQQFGDNATKLGKSLQSNQASADQAAFVQRNMDMQERYVSSYENYLSAHGAATLRGSTDIIPPQ
jgi:hypothetical protein